MDKKLQNPYPTNQNLWQAYRQNLIILRKELIKLNPKLDMIMNNAKREELNTNILSAVLNTQTLKMINAIQILMLQDLLMHANFLGKILLMQSKCTQQELVKIFK